MKRNSNQQDRNDTLRENSHLPKVKEATAEANDSFDTVEQRLAQLRATREEVSVSIFNLEERLRQSLGLGQPNQVMAPRPGGR